ncbi:TPA: Qat anti-phage system associated protein QatB [Bacillus thuringiensis]
MGTSSIYDGPKDRNPLLPDGFDEEYEPLDLDETENQNDSLESLWQTTKTAMSQYITGKHSNRGRIAKSHTKALGGANNAARSANSGTKSTVSLGKILSSIVTEGIHQTLNNLKISFSGKSVEALFSQLVNEVSRHSNSKEDIVAKNASIEALSQLYEFVEENEMELESLDRIDEKFFNKVMSTFISSYLFERLLNDLQSRFEKYAQNIDVATAKEREMREYIYEATEVQLKEINFSQIDYKSQSVESFIEGIYRDCYEVLEGYL